MRRRRATQYRGRLSSDIKGGPTHCNSCGLEMVEVFQPDGFFTDRAAVRYKLLIACPDWPELNHPTVNHGFYGEEAVRASGQNSTPKRPTSRIGFDASRAT